VAVVAAGVHLPGVHAGVSKRVVLSHWQRVDVRTQSDSTITAAVLDDADHPGLTQAPMHRNAPVGQGLGDQIRGALLLETKFGVSMNVASQGLHGSRIGQDRFDQLHIEALNRFYFAHQ